MVLLLPLVSAIILCAFFLAGAFVALYRSDRDADRALHQELRAEHDTLHSLNVSFEQRLKTLEQRPTVHEETLGRISQVAHDVDRLLIGARQTKQAADERLGLLNDLLDDPRVQRYRSRNGHVPRVGVRGGRTERR
jgi:uncharacterized coiled-coil protein SlyX